MRADLVSRPTEYKFCKAPTGGADFDINYPRACARGKVIGSVVVKNRQISRCRYPIASGQCC